MDVDLQDRGVAHIDRVTATLEGIRQTEGLKTALACAAGGAIGAVDWTARAAGIRAGAQLLIWVAERALPDLTEAQVEVLAAAVGGHLMRRRELHGADLAVATAEALIRGAAIFLLGEGQQDRVRTLLAAAITPAVDEVAS